MKQLILLLLLPYIFAQYATINSLKGYVNRAFSTVANTHFVGGRTREQYNTLTDLMTKNTAAFVANKNQFNQTIDKMVTVYCRNSLTNLTRVVVSNITAVTNPTRGYTFIIHDWKDTSEVYYGEEMISAYFRNIGDTNFCLVDYSPIAQTDFDTCAAPFAANVSRYMSGFIQNMSALYWIPIPAITLIGHGLGAQVAGMIGNNLGGAIGVIYALNPCGFNYYPRFYLPSQQLTAASAVYVETLATNQGGFGAHEGYYQGDQVYMINMGGPDQPGCGSGNDLCSHYRAADYLISSMNSSNVFFGRFCTNSGDFNAGQCAGNPCDRFGPFSARIGAGTFYLYTNSSEPFFKEAGCPSANATTNTKYATQNRNSPVNVGTLND